jgi:branched-chain amino acid transport system permease protein
MRIVNIAHGSFYMLGVYVAYTVTSRTHSLLLGVALAVAAVAAVGYLMQRFFLRRFAAAPRSDDDDDGVRVVLSRRRAHDLGRRPFTLTTPAWLNGSMDAGGVVFPWYRLFVIAIAALVGVGLGAEATGRSSEQRVRATVDDPEMAAATGINVSSAFGGVFAAGAALAAFGGVMGGPILGGLRGHGFRSAAAGVRGRDHRRHGQSQRRRSSEPSSSA